jgi:hypothetical protein
MTVEQNKVRRSGVGLRAYDAEKAWEGFTLFAPGTAGNTVYLIDMQGEVVHTWEMPHKPGLYGYLTDRGTLLYGGSIPNDTFIGRSRFHGGAVLEADWNGGILWEVQQPDHHHDARKLANGNVIILCSRALPDNLAPRVKGGRPGSEHEGKIHGDYLVEMTTEGKAVWEWRSWEHLDPEVEQIICPSDSREEWTHANSVYEMPDGNLLLSFRNTSSIVIVERASGKVIWRLGVPPLSGQHAPYLLPNGNILLFDNGPLRLDSSRPFSRVLEIDPATKTIVWSYQDEPFFAFFSDRISNAQRLPNGNTLIDEGVFGRLFEVTPGGEVVWEYVNPHFGPTALGETNQVFRAYRYSAEEIERARATAGLAPPSG